MFHHTHPQDSYQKLVKRPLQIITNIYTQGCAAHWHRFRKRFYVTRIVFELIRTNYVLFPICTNLTFWRGDSPSTLRVLLVAIVIPSVHTTGIILFMPTHTNKTVTLEDAHLIWISQTAEVPHPSQCSHATTVSLHSQYGQEDWLQCPITLSACIWHASVVLS